MAEDELFCLAGAGDTEALGVLADIAIAKAEQGIPEAWGAVEVFLRLAAANDDLHRVRLASFLLARGSFLKANGEAERGECLLRQAVDALRTLVDEGNPESLGPVIYALSFLADAGDELAAVEINTIMAAMPAANAAAIQRDIGTITADYGPPSEYLK